MRSVAEAASRGCECQRAPDSFIFGFVVKGSDQLVEQRPALSLGFCL